MHRGSQTLLLTIVVGAVAVGVAVLLVLMA
jgi:hypothetical protein